MSEEEVLGKDLRLEEDDLKEVNGDLAVVSGEDNLRQAILNRLRTRVGELSELGHPNYGSRLFDLVGELNNARTRELAKAYAKECVLRDPRVEKVEKIEGRTMRENPHRIDIEITLTPLKGRVALNIVYPFYLEGIE